MATSDVMPAAPDCNIACALWNSAARHGAREAVTAPQATSRTRTSSRTPRAVPVEPGAIEEELHSFVLRELLNCRQMV